MNPLSQNKPKTLADIGVDVGTAIRLGRMRCAWSQRDLAKFIGVTPTAVCAWEKNRQLPSADILIKLAIELDIVGDLFPQYAKHHSISSEEISPFILEELKRLWQAIHSLEANLKK